MSSIYQPIFFIISYISYIVKCHLCLDNCHLLLLDASDPSKTAAAQLKTGASVKARRGSALCGANRNALSAPMACPDNELETATVARFKSCGGAPSAPTP